jgi:hypothetical protein
MPTQSKPSIVFAHGIWADGSSFSKLIPTLQAERHDVPTLSEPRFVLDVIRDATTAVASSSSSHR